MEKCALLGKIMSRHRKAYVISYHGALCHDMSYITTIVASLVGMPYAHDATEKLMARWSTVATRVLVSLWGKANVQEILDGVTRNRTICRNCGGHA